MRYRSTRGADAVPLSVALNSGLAPDGGLFVPDLDAVDGWPSVGPEASLADRLAPFLAPEFDQVQTERLVGETLSFDLPLVRLEPGLWLLELVHGPSAAFKDVGARFLARALAAVGGDGQRRTVLVATSGDTGGAVAAAFHGVPGVRVVVLFPADGVTALQRRQFSTLGDNVQAIAVPGPFDACQALVKAALSSPELRESHGLTSANSINVGRLLPQMLYYWAATDALGAEGVEAPPVFVVPSGNLGNVGAGIMAARTAIPDARFVAALNRNDALARWLAGSEPDPLAPTLQTPSSAMDVARPSNLERLRWLAGGDATALQGELRARSVDDEHTLAMVGVAHERWGALVCPHTAVGLQVAEQLRHEGDPGPHIVLATAHAAKFEEVVEPVIGRRPELPQPLAERLDAPEVLRHLATVDLDELASVLQGLAP